MLAHRSHRAVSRSCSRWRPSRSGELVVCEEIPPPILSPTGTAQVVSTHHVSGWLTALRHPSRQFASSVVSRKPMFSMAMVNMVLW